ncbi:MAG: ferritin-like domain-containing protein [Actinomycetota bacterium]|nr:ferritin-like domain-containing protein [Actinomycetota bacterium]
MLDLAGEGIAQERSIDGRPAGATREQWIQRGLAGAAGVASGAILAGGFASLASSAAAGSQDVAVLNFALAFEQLQAKFYADAVRTLSLQGEWLQFAQVVGSHEQAHVAFLRRALGHAAKPVSLKLSHPPTDLAAFQRLAITLEDLGVALYNGQAANVSKAVLAHAAEIVSVEARHASWARDLAGLNPAPAATDDPASVTQVQARLKSAGVSVG